MWKTEPDKGGRGRAFRQCVQRPQHASNVYRKAKKFSLAKAWSPLAFFAANENLLRLYPIISILADY